MGEDLLWAVKNGDMDQLKVLIEEKNTSVKVELLNGRMAIHYAADYGHADVIEYLVSKGADVNIPDKYGITPILAAIYEGHDNCVKALLSAGAKKDGKAPDGQSYIECAEKSSIKDLLK
eukprot:Seg453.1 transcript_id=Seg453.1/GoldUCD/mRNA.D3Y31 product=Myotrophin protein_id=Seg453.1/GoldUCD/D3Y31